MPRAVLDPDVLVSALITPAGASARLLVHLRDGAFESVASPMLLAELNEVLAREKLRRYVTMRDVEAYVEWIRSTSVVIDDPEPAAEQMGPDPDDQYLIDLAAVSRVDALISGDPHLLNLRERIPVVSARAFLDLLGLEIGGLRSVVSSGMRSPYCPR